MYRSYNQTKFLVFWILLPFSQVWWNLCSSTRYTEPWPTHRSEDSDDMWAVLFDVSSLIFCSKGQCCCMDDLAKCTSACRRNQAQQEQEAGRCKDVLLLVSSCARYFSNPFSRTRSPSSWRNSSKAGPADSLLYISSSVLWPALQYMMPTFCW